MTEALGRKLTIINIVTDSPFSRREAEALSRLVGLMIPASGKHGVPAADDETILSDILGTARQYADQMQEGLQALDITANREYDESFSSLDQDRCMALVEELQQTSPRFLHIVTSITLQCYYRDTRVMESLGMEPRPPYPDGFELEQGDWSLLDPVRDRGRIWRDAGLDKKL